MKYLNTVLLIVLIAVVSINFYSDSQQKRKTEKLEKSLQALEEELSPFSQVPDAYYETKPEFVGPVTTISTDRKEHNFGTIKTGETYSTSFTITNTGKEDLIISKAEGSCGCTAAEWDKKPIKGGEKTTIKVRFDTQGKLGEQQKTLTITTNTNPNTTVFTIKAIVKK